MDDLSWRFKYHVPTAVKAEQHDSVRNACGALAVQLNEKLPEGREKALAITKLEEVMFWSNAALARE